MVVGSLESRGDTVGVLVSLDSVYRLCGLSVQN